MLYGKTFEDKTRRAADINRQNIIKILADNRDTDFGRRYGFASIDDVDAYRSRVPLSSYERFAVDIERMRKGEKNTLTVYPVLSYCKTSGTTGESKYIPVTVESMERFGNLAELHIDTLNEQKKGKRLFVNTFRVALEEPFEDTLIATEIYYRYIYEKGWFHEKEYVGGKLLNFSRNPGDSFYAKAWAALLTEELCFIESIFLYEQIFFYSWIEKNWERLLCDMERGVIPDEVCLDARTREFLLRIPRSADRLNRIRQAFAEGFHDILHRLWPGMHLVCGISNRAFFAEEEALSRYIGNVDKYYVWYGSSECLLGVALGENDYRYILHPDSAFFEFIPYEKGAVESDFSETRLPEELEIGQDYEVVITNFCGLYRYRMGDVVRVSGFCGEAPLVEFQFRKQQALNIAGEKTSVLQIEQVMKQLADEGVRVDAYCYGGSVEELPGRYIAALSMDDESKSAAFILADRIDVLLCRLNCDYEDLRGLGYIDKPRVFVYNQEEFRAFMTHHHLSEGQNKPRHIAPIKFSVDEMEGWRVERS